jgi:hypothetical protein
MIPMGKWKNRVVFIVMTLLSVSSLLFIITGYSALYWAWLRGNLQSALPYLPWARSFGILAIAGAAAALGILFTSNIFPVQPRIRLWLSLLVTVTIGLFSEFRNEGKFYFKSLHHFFAPGTWLHDGLNHLVSSLGDFLYRIEYSHWNDFLLGPAIVSVLFAVVFFSIYNAFNNQGGTISLGMPAADESSALDQKLRFARILMNVGLFWFFIQAWSEKAGFFKNPFSKDEIDLPFEFAGTMVGFWMARILTRPFGQRSERFRSTFLVDFVSSGVIGLLYTLIVGPLTEGLSAAVGRALYPVVPNSLGVHEYTLFQQHMRPIELLLLAAVTWWILNRLSKHAEMPRLGGFCEETQEEPKWYILKTMALVVGGITGCLLILAMMFSLLKPQGLSWTLTTLGAGIGAGTGAFFLVKRTWKQGFTTLFMQNDDVSAGAPSVKEKTKPPSD